MAAHHASLLLAAHATTTVAAQAAPAHASLYETCAGLIVAVLVVLYFDERVRRSLTARMRGYAIGSLGGIVGVGLLTPVFALAGLISDTHAIRTFTAIYTLAFLTFAFGIAIQNWAYEDGARMRAAQAPPPVTVPQIPVPPPREAQTEREHAAGVIAATMAIIGQVQGDAVAMCLARGGPAGEVERLRQLTSQWITMQPALIAISAGYPSAQVRQKTAAFIEAAAKVIEQPAILFADKANLASGEPPDEWREHATAAWTATSDAWTALSEALCAADQPGPEPAVNGRRPGRNRTSGKPSKTTAAQDPAQQP